MENRIEWKKTIPVTGEYDVVVCGGGPAGIAAAISASREGLRTALIERLGFLGGAATANMVIPISGFFFDGEQVAGGIAWELIKRLETAGAARVEYPKGHVSVHIETYKLIAQRMMQENHITVFTNAVLLDCVKQDEKITKIIVHRKHGMEAIAGSTFIDATGDGDLCSLAGVPMMTQTKELQPLSLCFLLDGVDLSTELLRDCIHHDGKDGRHSCNDEIQDYLSQCVQEGRLKQFGGPWFNTLVQGKSIAVNVTRAWGNAVDGASMQSAELQLREDMFTIVALLKERYPEFKECSIVASGINAGVRETRHIQAVETASKERLLKNGRCACPAACCTHPIDIHHADSSQQTLESLNRILYIPHTALIPQTCKNLLAAGRCISADRDVYATARVQATVMNIGEAAGIMAAVQRTNDCSVQELPLQELQRRFSERKFLLK